ncbi:MAG: LexA family transcriptional regulator [Bacteroidales bacterium]
MRGERITSRQKQERMRTNELLDALNIKGSTLSRWKNNINEPDDNTKIQLAALLHTSVAYLMGESNEADVTHGDENFLQLEKEGKIRGNEQLIMVPRISPEVKLPAGTGNCYESLQFDTIGEYPIFDGKLSALYSEESLTCMDVEGDSMEPQIHDGDVVIFDHCQDWIPGGIYVVCLEGRMLVKGLIDNGRDNPPILRSSNKEYPDIIIREEQFFIIYGRVLKILTDRAPKPII